MESTFLIEGQAGPSKIQSSAFLVLVRQPGISPPTSRLVLVTAVHVLEQMQGDVAVIHLRRRVRDRHKADQATKVWIQQNYQIQIRTNGRPLWARLATDDVAVMYFSPPPWFPKMLKPITPAMFAHEEFLSEYHVNPGDEVRFLGFKPTLSVSNEAGFPVLYGAKIDPTSDRTLGTAMTFLMPCDVCKGNSGGPVYLEGHAIGLHSIMGLLSEMDFGSGQFRGKFSGHVYHVTPMILVVVIHASVIKQSIDLLLSQPCPN